MSAAHKTSVQDMKKFTPREPRDEIRILAVRSLVKDLQTIADIRTAVNKAVGDGTTISVTSMALEDLEELRDVQFKAYGGRPVDDAAKSRIIENEIRAHREEAEAGKAKKKS